MFRENFKKTTKKTLTLEFLNLTNIKWHLQYFFNALKNIIDSIYIIKL